MLNSICFIVLSLPLLVNCYNSQFGAFNVDGMTLVYRGVYLYDEKDSPHTRKNGKSEISLDVKIVPRNSTYGLHGSIETLITTEDVFNKIGYVDKNGRRIACCDDYAYTSNICKNKDNLLLPKGWQSDSFHEKTVLSGSESSIKVNYRPSKTGIYYVLTSVCENDVTPLVMEGRMVVENPYGHLPATQYGSLPFYIATCFAYVIALIVWVMLCIAFSKEIMSVQVIILVVLICFVMSNVVKVLYLTVFNSTGNNVFFLAVLSMFVECTTRTSTRILTLLVCMGLGVCRTTLGNSTCKFIVFAVSYFIVSFWDAYSNMYPSTSSGVEFCRLLVTSGMDALVYFWIFQSLMDTMDELTEKKQMAKLDIFTRLRNLLVASVILATLTLILFSYIVVNDYAHHIWRYQWFINDGIWSMYYFLLILCIMIMWKPSENSSEYAYHIQVASDIQENDEEYGLPNETLVDSEEDGEVEVNTISNDMKPMNMTETTSRPRRRAPPAALIRR